MIGPIILNFFLQGQDGWKPILTLGNGVEISKRTSGSFHTFRSRFLLTSLSPYQFIIIPNTIDAAKQWDPHLVEASIICLMFRDHSKPPFRNRDFVVYERCENMEDGTLVVAVVSLPKEIAAGLEPQQNDAIRGLLLQSGWVVEKLQGHSCMVAYVVQLVMIIENLKKLAQASIPIDAQTS
ncbi:unnamed protein product [Malus baccata var. baccata]